MIITYLNSVYVLHISRLNTRLIYWKKKLLLLQKKKKQHKKLLNWLLDLNEFHFLNFKISVIVFPHCDKYVKFNTKFQLTLYNFYITPMYVLRIGQNY